MLAILHKAEGMAAFKQLVRDFIAQITHHPIELTASNFYTINYPFLAGV